MSDNNQPFARVLEATTCNGVTLWTLHIRYHRFIHGEFMTHRVFNKNASSSRAIPIARMVQRADAMPLHWGSNRPGMQAGAELTGWRLWAVKKLWRLGMAFTKRLSLSLAKLGLHKQLANRWTETSQWIDVIVTATEWDNFFLLRDHEKAQPEIAALARKIRQAMFWSGAQGYKQPREVKSGDRFNVWNWHLPFVTFEEREAATRMQYDSRSLWHNCLFLAKISSARCARVSYANHDGSAPVLSRDYKLFGDLTSDPKVMHLSPTEHQGYPMPAPWQWSKNLRGFRQHRELLERPGYDD